MTDEEEKATHIVLFVNPAGYEHQVGTARMRSDGRNFDLKIDTPVGTGHLVLAPKEEVEFEIKVDFPPGYRKKTGGVVVPLPVKESKGS